MVVATGFFDGVHTGHRQVIDSLTAAAKERGTGSLVITFWPHPRTVLQNDAASLRLLTSMDEKKEKLLEAGVDRVEVLPFSREFSSMTARDYLEQVVMGRFSGTAIVLGYDNRLGSDGLGRDEVGELAIKLGLEVINPPAVTSGDVCVSSSKIRESLASGDVGRSSLMLGYNYFLKGVVVSGNRLGRTIGFPTANMQIYEPLKLVPSNGVYLVDVKTLGGHFYGMTNIGTRPTVTGIGNGDLNALALRTIETHIFDFDSDIYGLDIEVSFIRKMRDEVRFGSMDGLRRQLEEDEKACLRIIGR